MDKPKSMAFLGFLVSYFNCCLEINFIYEILIFFFLFFSAVVIVTIIMLSCCGDFARKTPHNYICLFLFTIAEGFLVGVSASIYNWQIVLTAVAITAVIVIALTIFAFQTKIDFTVFSGILFVLMFVFMIFGIVAIFWRGPIVHLVYSCFGALLFSAVSF